VLGRSLLLPPTHAADRDFNSETDCEPGKLLAGAECSAAGSRTSVGPGVPSSPTFPAFLAGSQNSRDFSKIAAWLIAPGAESSSPVDGACSNSSFSLFSIFVSPMIAVRAARQPETAAWRAAPLLDLAKHGGLAKMTRDATAIGAAPRLLDRKE
jgi:hypothetical protein